MSHDDKDRSLRELSQHHRASIISQLVEIGSKGNQQEHLKFRSFISSLQCLQLKRSELRRQSINAFTQRRYVALSYTWTPSKYENPETGWYPVEDWDNEHPQLSSVRKCVLDRVLSYMRHAGVRYLWIDAHCIRQDKCDVDDCSHPHCTEKRNAIQAMDLVYQLSEYPVALLGRELRTTSELYLLKQILSGDLVDGDAEFRLSAGTAVYMARKALLLLSNITEDSWWCRAWTFQENYRGGIRMQLLIHHDQSLERQKRRYRIFGKIPCELCMSSVAFSTQVTRLCQALRGVTGLPRPDVQRIDSVLRAAKRYALIIDGSSSMTPTVIADIEARGLSKPWDRLAIVANCCQYPVRLDCGALSRQRRSPSLSVLAMCLLNGEILDNGKDDIASVAGLTTSEFLNSLMFRAFNAPEDDTRRLTFNKGCRLTDVELTEGGIAVWGHLWKLGRVVDTSTFWQKLPRINEPSGRLTLEQRKRLLQLVFHLHDLEHHWLADKFDNYLTADADAGEDYASFTEMYLYRMAVEIADAIRVGQKLRLASIWDSKGRSSAYRAVFVCSDEAANKTDHFQPAFVFTSARQGDPGSYRHDANDIDRHVSIQVELEESLSSRSLQHLRVCNWLLGICFFGEYARTKVLFPWPRSLQAVKP